jgi:DnaJ-class molecular chaperone
MSEILRRLARLTRVHLHDLFEHYSLRGRTIPAWDYRDTTPDDPEDAAPSFHPPFEAPTDSHLPYSAELAGCYRALDLPFGAPVEQVAKRWKTYLKKCHPDLHANDPEKQADATRLTQELTRAYEKIKAAWERHQPSQE